MNDNNAKVSFLGEPTHCRHYYGPVSIQLNCERDDCEFGKCSYNIVP